MAVTEKVTLWPADAETAEAFTAIPVSDRKPVRQRMVKRTKVMNLSM